MSSRWVNWFSPEATSTADADFSAALERAHECLRVSEMPWFLRYLEHLDAESSKPGKIGDHVDMIASVSRANALKEMRFYLLSEIERARALVQSTKEA